MIYLHVTFTLEAQDVPVYEQIYSTEFMPVIDGHGMKALGIWKTVVGKAGEFTEIWEFADLADFEEKWNGLMADPRVAEIFKKTGPLVKNETFKLMSPAPFM